MEVKTKNHFLKLSINILVTLLEKIAIAKFAFEKLLRIANGVIII
jgi:hypothetical protein